MRLARRAIAPWVVALAMVGLAERDGWAQRVSDAQSGSMGGAIAQVEQPSTQNLPISGLSPGSPYPPNACIANLQTSIDSIIKRPTFQSAHWGIRVEALDNETPIYSHNDNQYFIPASNIKLLTTAAALQSLHFSDNRILVAFHDWIVVTNRDSNNGHADALLRRMGGPQQVSQTLTSLGINPNDYRQVDGSGLSRSNIAKPKTFISVLKAMTQTSEQAVFYNSLPVAGYSGTLRYRFQGTAAQGTVRAKTGTLRGVRALSGYLETRQQGTFVFSILVNQEHQSGTTMLQAIDEIVLLLTHLDRCYGASHFD